MNFNINQLKATLPELLDMLRTTEATIKWAKPVMLAGPSSMKLKPKGKGKKKKKGKKIGAKGEVSKPKVPREQCYNCGKKGH